MLDLLIIGAGPIGLFAAFNAGMRNFKAAIIEAQPYVGGQLTTIYGEKPIYDIPGIKEIKAKDFINQLYEQYRQFADKVPLYLNTKFYEIIAQDDHFIVKTAQQEFLTKTVLITLGNGGFNPRKLDVPNSDQYKNIVYFVSDLNQFKDKDVVVLGGGDSAFDWANMLLKVAASTSLVHRRNEFRAHDESIALFKKGGTIYTPYIIDHFVEEDAQNVKALVIKNIENQAQMVLKADYVVVNYGFLPSLIKYSNFNLENDDKGILVTSEMKTSLAGVYGAGNCVYYPGKLKTIAAGLGEAATAIHAINNYLFPAKNNLPVFSSILMQKKK